MHQEENPWRRATASILFLAALLALTGTGTQARAQGAMTFRSTALATPEVVSAQAGATVHIAVTITSGTDIHAHVGLYIFDESGHQVRGASFTDEAFAAHQARSFPMTWTVAPGAQSGVYRVAAGVFAPNEDWDPNHHWNDYAAFISVGRAEQDPQIPSNHLGVGVKAPMDGERVLQRWMPDTGVPWSFAYQYFNGGVHWGWADWDGNGMRAVRFAVTAAHRGYVPVLTYYQLLESNDPCNKQDACEQQQVLENLNDLALMTAFYRDFELLMKRLGPGTHDGVKGYGRTAIVHVEPDLSGYAQVAINNPAVCGTHCDAQASGPAKLKAVVSSSGLPHLASFPNTYQGFNWALLSLRNTYAPNVKLAFHVSSWATGLDIGESSDPNVNPRVEGQRAGEFAAQSGVQVTPPGIPGYDYLFNDPKDHDSGWYKYKQGDPSAYWDQLNLTLPNFHRWEAFIDAARQVVNKPVYIWQIPLGNQYFRTVNNTRGHYQDNKVEYFFNHIDELRNVGIAGLLFGGGNPGVTEHWDARSDGITNPPAISNSDGISSGQVITNHHVSTVPDDDGGYLRMRAGQYYTGLGLSP
jgi:hypothetical protein